MRITTYMFRLLRTYLPIPAYIAYTHTYIHTYIHAYIHPSIHPSIHTYIRIHAHTHTCTHTCSRVPGPHPPPPPMVSPPPFPVPGPRPRAAPAPGGPGQPERTHANQSEGGRWRMIPASASSQERRTASEQGQGAPFARRKEQHHTLYGNEHVTMTLLLTSVAATIPYLCRTHCPTQAGRGQPKRPQAPPHRGGRGQGT